MRSEKHDMKIKALKKLSETTIFLLKETSAATSEPVINLCLSKSLQIVSSVPDLYQMQEQMVIFL